MASLQKIIKTANKGVSLTLITGTLYFSALFGMQTYASLNAPSIQSESDLIAEINKRKEVLQLDSLDIQAEFSTEAISRSHKIGSSTYEIELGGYLANHAILDHEIYHIADGHAEHSANFFSRYFWGEPQAVIYSVFGLRL